MRGGSGGEWCKLVGSEWAYLTGIVGEPWRRLRDGVLDFAQPGGVARGEKGENGRGGLGLNRRARRGEGVRV
jgi:hypothetical protein